MSNLPNTLHPNLQHYVSIAPLLEKLFSEDVVLTISDKEKVVGFSSPLIKVAPEGVIGRRLEADDPMVQVIRTNREHIFEVPASKFGSDMRIAIIPVRDEQNKAIGTFAASFSIQNRVALIEIAKTFGESSDQIHASTISLDESATTLTDYMSAITNAQQNLVNQVNDSAKILEMINSVAKSTRILGFNAGIEAARSGDAGLGFAVVAREITKLAEQSANSVKEIGRLLDEMKKRAEEVSDIITDTANVSEKQADAIHSISESIEELTHVAVKIDELANKL
ncbi:MAG: methyl-accepting chemotaxis protein [Caryophanon sp.]|nr:methyl-accepting chemotaxis protein [Caryophanon sp.]